MWDIEMVVSVAAADEDEWTREDMEWWGSQVPAEIFSLDFWVVERKHTFLVFTAIQLSSTEGTDTSLCCQLCIKTICRLKTMRNLQMLKVS